MLRLHAGPQGPQPLTSLRERQERLPACRHVRPAQRLEPRRLVAQDHVLPCLMLPSAPVISLMCHSLLQAAVLLQRRPSLSQSKSQAAAGCPRSRS